MSQSGYKQQDRIRLRVDYLPSINYSLINNRISICQSVEISNLTNEDIRDVAIACSGEFFRDSRSTFIDVLKAGAILRLQGVNLMPDPVRVASITERVQTSFCIKVMGHEDQLLFAQDYDIEVKPFDEWLGTGIQPQCLASFVLPNHPAIQKIIVKAGALLKEISRSSAFTEYQSGNTNEVRKQVAAVYGALHAENLVYRAMPASYEEVGQRITLPDQVLQSKLGNCIELTILFASVLESIGINSGIILQQGHAYLAVWLVDDCCPYSVCDDASYIEKKCAEGIDEMLVLECTQVTQEKTSFEEAQAMARKQLADNSLFRLYIDIRRCRLERIFPLPQRVWNNGVWEIPADGVNHDECVLNVREHSRYDLSSIMDSKHQITKMDIWERKLLDFSLRNSMLNLYLRQKAIQFISFDVDLVEDYLQDGNEYVIAPKPNVEMKVAEDGRLIQSKLLPELHDLITNDVNHHTLHTYHTEQETRNTLKNIYRASRNAIEETGANALYLAIGTLRWFETELSETPRYAPILLMPVEMVYKKGDYYVRSRDQEVALNITLVEFLRQNFDIDIPGLNPLPTDEHGVDVKKIFAIIREVLVNQKRWDVEEESILGVFSFSKYLMWNDIHNHREELMQSDVVRSLVEQKLTFTPSEVVSDLKNTDKSLRPEALALPVPIDSSQMAAVMEAGEGHSFILYGPPGTGKSQTITNLIANALYQGKRVLFVAEKMAALSVVQKRLEKIQLAPFCLEMHSNKITKRHVLDQLKKALAVTHIVAPKEYARRADELFEQRTRLIAYMEALHDVKGQDGLSLYDCIVRYSSLQAAELGIDPEDDELQNQFRITEQNNYDHLLSDKYRAVVNLIGQPSAHPLQGLTVDESDLATTNHLPGRLKEALEVIAACNANRSKYADLDESKAAILRDCKPEILSADANGLYNQWRAVKAKWFIPRFFAKRSFLAQLRQYNEYLLEADVDALLVRLTDYAAKHAEVVRIQNTVNQLFDTVLDGNSLPTEQETALYTTLLNNWLEHTDKARDWYQWCAYKEELCAMGLRVVAQRIEQTPIPADTLRDSFFKTMYKHLANKKMAQSSILRTFEGSIFDETVVRYQKMTEEFQMLSQKELYARLAAKIPHVTNNIDISSPIGLLNRNISNGGRGVSLRDLFAQISPLLPKLCPCMLMSPMSVAQFLDIAQDKFDLVVFDEASQMPTSEAVGAIARGKSVVVVGDPKQMPPTSFFSSTSVGEEEAEIDDMESILEDCRTLEIPSLQLNWHYRSQHESLIAFSNNEFYDGSLITFPSADDRATKVSYHPIDGVYDKGGRRSNRREAEAIVQEVARRLQAPDHAQHSIGIIAFSVVQQNLIEDMLMDLLEKNRNLREAADAMYEPIFVKNLENVQGDERDIIMFSIGYGPDKNGKVSMNFGPLNNAGGERRLNVAVSRARREMLVFSSLKASQIDLRRTKARGVEGLKHFLEYAEQQILVQAPGTRQETTDTALAEDIAKALRQRGYQADTNIGRSNFKVDIAIGESQGTEAYTLGILLDGEGYHSTQTTRDREIVQPSVLRMLGWKILRVWSVDWFNNPERVLSRIEAAIKAKAPAPSQPIKTSSFDLTKEKVVCPTSSILDYKEYPGGKDVESKTDKALTLDILACEQPMTPAYLCRRVCYFRGKPRVTPSLQAAVTEVIESYTYQQQIGSSTIVWKSQADAKKFTGFREANGRDITEIPLVEVMNAIEETVGQQFCIKSDLLPLLAAKQMGFIRRGAKIDQVIQEALDILLATQRIVESEGMLKLPE